MDTDIDIDPNDPEKRAKLRELALSDRDSAPLYYELYIEYYDEEPEPLPEGDGPIASGDEPQPEAAGSPSQHENMREQLEAAGYDVSPPDADPCEYCGDAIDGVRYDVELEYPSEDGGDGDPGSFSGEFCRECSDAVATIILGDRGG